jgi:quinoprotein glucose dehydrogenase
MRLISDVLRTGVQLEKQSAIQTLAHAPGREAEALLAGLLDDFLAGTLPAEIQLDTIEAAARRDSRRLKEKLARVPADDAARWRLCLEGGDPERGRRIFREHAAAQCVRCHKCEIGESEVGPELTRIGAAKDRAYLLESILHPDRQIAEGFETVVLTLVDGSVVAGTLAGEDADSVKVKSPGADGAAHIARIARAQIRERQRAPSAMPPVAEFLSRLEVRDLVEYLATRK